MAALEELWIETVSEFYPQTEEEAAPSPEKEADKFKGYDDEKIDALIK